MTQRRGARHGAGSPFKSHVHADGAGSRLARHGEGAPIQVTPRAPVRHARVARDTTETHEGAAPARRTNGFGTSIFTEISALAVAHDAVNLGQGFPDFPAPAFIKDAAMRAIREDRNQYAPAAGLPRLRAALAARWERLHGVPADADAEVTVASGATELLHDAVLAIVEPGDEVIVFEPTYDAYVPDIIMAGGVARPVALRPPEWRWDPAELRAAFTPRTRAVILNTPHNPTGKMFTRDELEELASLCQAHDVVVISDEVYSEITFDGAAHVPIATLPGMRERTISIDSMGKTFSVTGWKVGWAIAPPPLTNALRAIHQFVTFTNSVPFQEALADGGSPLAETHGHPPSSARPTPPAATASSPPSARSGLAAQPAQAAPIFLLRDRRRPSASPTTSPSAATSPPWSASPPSPRPSSTPTPSPPRPWPASASPSATRPSTPLRRDSVGSVRCTDASRSRSARAPIAICALHGPRGSRVALRPVLVRHARDRSVGIPLKPDKVRP